MDRLGIEMLSVFGMPPIEFVHLTADLGCRYITTGMVGFAPVKTLRYQRFRCAMIPGYAGVSLQPWTIAACRSRWVRVC